METGKEMVRYDTIEAARIKLMTNITTMYLHLYYHVDVIFYKRTQLKTQVISSTSFNVRSSKINTFIITPSKEKRDE